MAPNTTCHAPTGLKYACLEPMPLTTWLPLSPIIIVASVVILAICKHTLELWFESKYCSIKDKYLALSSRNQRTLVNHVQSLFSKIFLLLLAAYPYFKLVSGSPFDHRTNGRLTIGSLLLLASNLYTAMYLFELCFRKGISWVAWFHHTAAAIMAQFAIWYTTQPDGHDSVIELVLCLTWGIFDVLTEGIPHFTLILYRFTPDKYRSLHHCFLAAFAVTVLSTIAESAVVFWMWGGLFDRWSTSTKTLTPIFHLLFTAAQIWSAKGLWERASFYSKAKRGDIERGASTEVLAVVVESTASSATVTPKNSNENLQDGEKKSRWGILERPVRD